MAKQTGQITVLKNNTVTNVEHQIRFIFTKENGDQKVLPLRAGLFIV